MFQLVTESDGIMHVLAFPSVDISGVNASPPLVDCGQHPQLGGRIYLSALHVTEAVRVIAPVLSSEYRSVIATNVGAIGEAEAEELIAENVRLTEENAKLKEAMATPWAEVYDFAKEKARIELARETEKQPA